MPSKPKEAPPPVNVAVKDDSLTDAVKVTKPTNGKKNLGKKITNSVKPSAFKKASLAKAGQAVALGEELIVSGPRERKMSRALSSEDFVYEIRVGVDIEAKHRHSIVRPSIKVS